MLNDLQTFLWGKKACVNVMPGILAEPTNGRASFSFGHQESHIDLKTGILSFLHI